MRPPSRPALLLAAALGVACAPERVTAPASAPPSASRAPADACPAACARAGTRARARLERAAAGLTYTSESDYPFEFVSAPATSPHRPRGALDEAGLRAAFAIPPDAHVEVTSLDDFFARHIERVDPADHTARGLVPRYRALRRIVQTVTGSTRVYRVGEIQIRCYLVGVDAWGNVIGLATTAIET
jgi:hypothetical protein